MSSIEVTLNLIFVKFLLESDRKILFLFKLDPWKNNVLPLEKLKTCFIKKVTFFVFNLNLFLEKLYEMS